MEKINIHFNDSNTKNEIIAKYFLHLNQIEKIAKRHQILGVEYNYLMLNIQQNINNQLVLLNNKNTQQNYAQKCIHFLWQQQQKRKYFLLRIAIALIIFGLFYYKTEVSSIFMQNIQNYIYPGMSLWRKITLPILRVLPNLSSLYDETCLMPNPFFQISDFDCSPCMEAVNIMDLTNIPHQVNNVPYIFKTNTTATKVNLKTFYDIFIKHKDIFKNDAYKVQSTNKQITNLDELFNDFLNGTHQNESHNLWRCNRMTPARLLRQQIPHPKISLPSIGMSIERYLTIDTMTAPSYPIPDIDCSNVFIVQLMGSRTIILRPTMECRQKCRTLSVRLQESHVLNYDWWYWKPISVPSHQSQSVSFSYIGAFC